MASRRAGEKRAPDPRRDPSTAGDDQRARLVRLLVGAVVFAVTFAGVLIFLNSRGGETSTAIKATADRIDSSLPRDGRTLGDPAAPILVAEYADYQCPFCTNFALTGMPGLLDEYVATGQVRLEYHHFVVIGRDDPDGESYRAAEAAECARDQGMFWDYHELLYTNSLGEFQGSFTSDRLKSIAELVPGLDRAAFASCVDARTHRAEVVRMSVEGRTAGVSATPTFVVNGTLVAGGYDALKEAIDERLAST